MKPEFEKTLNALKILYQKVDPNKTHWVLVGSSSLILQGVDVPVTNDIDIMARAVDCPEISNLLADYVISSPTGIIEGETTRCDYSAYNIDGVNLDLVGDIQNKLPDGSWSEIRNLDNYETLNIGGMKLRVLSLYEEMRGYAAGGREDKVSAILKKLNNG